jgi:hypothetical protein
MPIHKLFSSLFSRRREEPAKFARYSSFRLADIFNENGYVNQNRFQIALKRVSTSTHFRPYFDLRHPYGFFHNRPVIGENTRVGGGVYLSAQPVEALVVDEKYDLLRPILSSFRGRLGGLKSFSVERELSILEDIFELANDVLEWSPHKVKRFNQQHGIKVDTKVALDFYIEQKFGVARHKVLLAAYLIEKLKEDGHLSGNFIIPETIRRPNGDDEYLVYTFPNGVFATLDPNPSDEESTIITPIREKSA